MSWQLSWLGEAGEQAVDVFSSKAAAKRAAESLGGDLVWRGAVVLGASLGEEEDVLVAASDTGPDGSWTAGEYIIGRASWDQGLGAPIPDYGSVQREDRDNPLVPIVNQAIRDRKYLAYQYTNSKRKTHPGLIRPTGWHTYQHAHDWAGGYTLCVVGFAYDHREERHYAIRRMADVHVLDDPGDELERLGWAAEPGQSARQPKAAPTKPVVSPEPARPGIARGDLVQHDRFGRGKVMLVDVPNQRVVVAFDSAGTKKLALGVAPLKALSPAGAGESVATMEREDRPKMRSAQTDVAAKNPQEKLISRWTPRLEDPSGDVREEACTTLAKVAVEYPEYRRRLVPTLLEHAVNEPAWYVVMNGMFFSGDLP